MTAGTHAEGDDEEVTTDRVVDIAITHFSHKGYTDTKLDSIAKESGMSKRMIHYHFGDKQGLYQKALGSAARRLIPPMSELRKSSGVPVEGIRKLVDLIYEHFVQDPEAVRLLTQESVIKSLDGNNRRAVADLSELSLHLDKLLMVGQDSGAFRPGISANDIFTIIAGLSMYRTTNHDMVLNLLGVDMTSERNTEGIHRLVVDTVLAFLTSNIPDTGEESYVVSEPVESDTDSSANIYSADGDLYS